MQGMRRESKSLSREDKIWISCMEWGSSRWGCHQMPERSFFIKGYQFPICARCTGILSGYIIGGFSMFFIKFCKKEIIFCVPLLLDGTLQLFSRYESTNQRRFLSGLLFGIAFIRSVIHILLFFIKLWEEKAERRIAGYDG